MKGEVVERSETGGVVRGRNPSVSSADSSPCRGAGISSGRTALRLRAFTASAANGNCGKAVGVAKRRKGYPRPPLLRQFLDFSF